MADTIHNPKLKVENSVIEYEAKGSILNPLKSLSFMGRKPVTEPLE